MNDSFLLHRYRCWIALKFVPGIGSRTFKLLIDRFGSPEKAAAAGRSALLGVKGMTRKSADAVLATVGNGRFPEAVLREADLVVRRGYRLITLTDEEYPRLLAEIHDPPPFLYAFGSDTTFEPAVAVVGSRNPTQYGLSMARRLGADLAAAGFVVVSGMAAGIDATAHRGALSAGGKTAAVLGSGLGVIYPVKNKNLYHDIAGSGCVLSEQRVLEPPESYHFPARNRIISGMTLGTVVVEAARKSGSLITAYLAAEQGREVFAVPGSIDSTRSIGAHGLLKQGARLVEGVDDILEEFSYVADWAGKTRLPASEAHPCPGGESKAGLTPAETGVYYLLEPYPAHIDDIANRAGMDTAALLAILLKLELAGLVIQAPGKFFMSTGDK